MHVSKDSMWRRIWKILQNFLGTKQDLDCIGVTWKYWAPRRLCSASCILLICCERKHCSMTGWFWLINSGEQSTSLNLWILLLLLLACIHAKKQKKKKKGLELSISVPAFASAMQCNHESQDQVKPFVDLCSPTTTTTTTTKLASLFFFHQKDKQCPNQAATQDFRHCIAHTERLKRWLVAHETKREACQVQV
jgi:hypothetical protein